MALPLSLRVPPTVLEHFKVLQEPKADVQMLHNVMLRPAASDACVDGLS